MDPTATELQEAYHDEDKHGSGELLERNLSDVPRRDALIVAPHENLSAVVERMNDRSVGCALVVEDGALVGIFTERDVLKKMAARGLDTNKVLVKDLMTRQPDTLPEETTVAFALNRMSVEGYRHIPLVDVDGKAIGVVGMRDIINWLVELHPDKVHNVPPAPSSYPKKREGG